MRKPYFLVPCDALSFTGASAVSLECDALVVVVPSGGQVTVLVAWMRLKMWLKSAWPLVSALAALNCLKVFVWQE